MRYVEHNLRRHLLSSSTNPDYRFAKLLSKFDLRLNPISVIYIHPGDEEEATALSDVLAKDPA